VRVREARELLAEARKAKAAAAKLVRAQVKAARKALPERLRLWRTVNRDIMRRALAGERAAVRAANIEARTGTRERAAQLYQLAQADIDRELEQLRWLGRRAEHAKAPARVKAALRAAERRAEADEFVKAELPPEWHAAWEEHKHRIKGTKNAARYEKALEFFAEHGALVNEANERARVRSVDATLADEERAWMEAHHGTPELAEWERSKAKAARAAKAAPPARARKPRQYVSPLAGELVPEDLGRSSPTLATATASPEHLAEMVELLDPREFGFEPGPAWESSLRTYPGRYEKRLWAIKGLLRKASARAAKAERKRAARDYAKAVTLNARLDKQEAKRKEKTSKRAAVEQRAADRATRKAGKVRKSWVSEAGERPPPQATTEQRVAAELTEMFPRATAEEAEIIQKAVHEGRWQLVEAWKNHQYGAAIRQGRADLRAQASDPAVPGAPTEKQLQRTQGGWLELVKLAKANRPKRKTSKAAKTAKAERSTYEAANEKLKAAHTERKLAAASLRAARETATLDVPALRVLGPAAARLAGEHVAETAEDADGDTARELVARAMRELRLNRERARELVTRVVEGHTSGVVHMAEQALGVYLAPHLPVPAPWGEWVKLAAQYEAVPF
jgi:hypothetical protein